MAPRIDIPGERVQVADLDTRDWIVVPADFTKQEYDLRVAPGRLAACPAVEKAAREVGAKYENSAIDSLDGKFIGWNDAEQATRLTSVLGTPALTLRQARDWGRLLDQGRREKKTVSYVSGDPLSKEKCGQIFDDAFGVIASKRAEWYGTKFEQRENGLYELSGLVYYGNFLNPIEERKLTKTTLMRKGLPGINLASWIKSRTKQGVPTQNIDNGSTFYWGPRACGFAGFSIFSDGKSLVCGGNPTFVDPSLGVRVAEVVRA